MSKRKRLKGIENALDLVNSKSDQDFIRDYLAKEVEGSPGCWTPTWQHPRTGTFYNITLSRTEKTSEADLEACYSLIEETSRKDYEASSCGWNAKAKRTEMRDPNLRYILVKDPAAAGRVCGYTSLMPTMEEGEAVVYCYEIHLEPGLRGTGLAGLLMGVLETVARNIAVIDKVMLTVFTCNTKALDFYRRRGMEVDNLSPRSRKLRNGVVKEPDYAIMSKRVERVSKTLSDPVGQESLLFISEKKAKLEPAFGKDKSASGAID